MCKEPQSYPLAFHPQTSSAASLYLGSHLSGYNGRLAGDLTSSIVMGVIWFSAFVDMCSYSCPLKL